MNLFKIKSHDKMLPKLIIFINSYIHISTSNYFLSRFSRGG
jgi:hypothetical protein